MSERLAQSLLLGWLILLLVKGVRAEPPKDPIYVKTSTGWNAAYAHGNAVIGSEGATLNLRVTGY